MLDPVLFLVGPGVLMFLDHTGLVIVHSGTGHQAGLDDGAHSLTVDVVAGRRVLQQHPAGQKIIQVLLAPLVHLVVVGIH